MANARRCSKPWLPLPESSVTYNVQTESEKPDSIFNTYKQLLALRKSDSALRDGSYEAVDVKDEHVFTFLRHVHTGTEDETVVVALNMSAQPRTIAVRASGAGTVLFRSPLPSANTRSDKLSLNRLVLEPFGVVVARVE
jgi:glycosidase